jgi:hypothetical protein
MKDKLKNEIANSLQFLLILLAAFTVFIISQIAEVEYSALDPHGDAGHINIREMFRSEMYFIAGVLVWFIIFALVRLGLIYLSSRSSFPQK